MSNPLLKISIFLGLPKFTDGEYNRYIDPRNGDYGKDSNMECIVISESKLKIMLNRLDMAHYELGNGELDCASASTRAAFRHIFEDAGVKAGFDTEGARLFVQLYASKEGGCEIFVTKLEGGAWQEHRDTVGGESLGPRPRRDGLRVDRGEDALLRVVKEVEVNQPTADGRVGGRWYRFEALGDLLACCRALALRGKALGGAAYIDERHGERYYLELPANCGGRESGDAVDLAAEFGVPADRDTTELYLAEHGRCLCGTGAVELLGKC